MKKEKTFADRAKALKLKYSRSEWDAIERKELNQKLRELRDEQEAMRAAMGIADYADKVDEQEQQMKYGGEILYQTGGDAIDNNPDDWYTKKGYIKDKYGRWVLSPAAQEERFSTNNYKNPNSISQPLVNDQITSRTSSIYYPGMNVTDSLPDIGSQYKSNETPLSSRRTRTAMPNLKGNNTKDGLTFGQKMDMWRKNNYGRIVDKIKNIGNSEPELNNNTISSPNKNIDVNNNIAIEGSNSGVPNNFELPYKNVPQVPTYSAAVMSNGPLRNPQPRSNFVPIDVNISGIQPPPVGQGYGQWNPGNQMVGLAPKPSMPSAQNQYQPISSSIAPFAISAGASAIGDIASMISARKNMPKSVNLPRMRAEQINLQPQREALQRGYNTASNIMLRNARDVSSPGNAYANQIAGQSQLMDSYGTQMGQSYMNEANTNAQMRQQTGLQNQQVGVQEALQNVQLKQQNAQVKNQFINSLSQTIPNALRDYRQQVNQDNMINTMGLYYGLYEQVNPNMTFMEKLQKGLLGGHNNTILSRRDQRIRQ